MEWVLVAVVVFQMFAIIGIVTKLEQTRTLVKSMGEIVGQLIEIMKLSEQRRTVEQLSKTVDDEFKKIINNGWES